MIDCFLKSKSSQDNAKAMADLLAEADYRGHFSHGMNRLEMYINDLHINSTDGNATPTILNETPATAWVDGRNGLGAVVIVVTYIKFLILFYKILKQVVGNFCMDLAIEKAKTTGVGVVCAKSISSHNLAFRSFIGSNLKHL